jgi:hypothetical protein
VDFKILIKKYKLSSDLQKFILSGREVYSLCSAFKNWRWGELHLFSLRPGFDLAVQHWRSRHPFDSEVANLHEKIKASGPPADPLVKAVHLSDQFSGPRLGQVLKQVYIQQLDENWKSLSQAQEWIRLNFNSDDSK